ncbi:MAG: hypothetical protein CHKLHMKO_00571 [Candidatus Argoarchaeum ethanivorans]|uniref:DUF2341 domain-containing protein n=1 Tax=Candidatus Argoarchaeum ethanivorans TaxID=2608793 RepID=A0A811T9A7_9EURY|nr:MAG: hypothetical protein CHKLHMKO_00571 [Candidatus Argoarchaeum ethanivorans]
MVRLLNFVGDEKKMMMKKRGLFAITVLTVLLFIAAVPTTSADPGWWDTNWSHRKAITITENSGSTLTNYQVELTVTYDSDMKDNFDDLRFINVSGAELDYWIESRTDGNSATVWVEVDSLAASSDATIYMYYGNSEASSESNGSAVFEFFDDFDAGLGKWNNFGSPTPVTFESAEFHDGWGYSTKGDHTYRSGSYSKALLDVTSGTTVDFRVKQGTGHNHWDRFRDIGIGSLQSGYTESSHPEYFTVALRGGSENDITYQAYNGKTYTEEGADDHQFHRYSMKYNSSNDQIAYYRDEQLNTTLTADSRPDNTLPFLLAGRDYSGTGTTNYLDWVLVRKYADPEPGAVFGNEDESHSQRWYLSSIGSGTYIMYKGNNSKPAGTVAVSDEGEQIWLADESAAGNISFPADTWTGHITFDASSSDTTVLVWVGEWNGSTFTPSAAGENATISGSGDFSISAGEFGVSNGEWLAFRIQDHDADGNSSVVSVGLSSSYLTSGGTDPAYPIPELPAMILFSVGLLVLTGYFWLRWKN